MTAFEKKIMSFQKYFLLLVSMALFKSPLVLEIGLARF